MAASDTTRLLVLGVACLFEPANGYQLRRELLSWRVESWGNVNPGSIYSMLGTLTSQGLLERHDIVPDGASRPVAVYRSTPAGREQLLELIRDALVTVQTFDRTSFYAALSLSVSVLARAEVAQLLQTRVERLQSAIDSLTGEGHANRDTGFSPPHVARMFEFPVALDEAERVWVTGFRASVLAGEMLFADDDWAEFSPNPADPGYRMIGEAASYIPHLPPRSTS